MSCRLAICLRHVTEIANEWLFMKLNINSLRMGRGYFFLPTNIFQTYLYFFFTYFFFKFNMTCFSSCCLCIFILFLIDSRYKENRSKNSLRYTSKSSRWNYNSSLPLSIFLAIVDTYDQNCQGVRIKLFPWIHKNKTIKVLICICSKTVDPWIDWSPQALID